MDADATPRPLRIIKRESNTISDFSFSEAATIGHPSNTSGEAIRQEKIDTRRRSSEVEQRPPAILAKPVTSIASPHPQAHTCNALHVPKQRRTNTKRASSVLGSIVGNTLSHPSGHIRTWTSRHSTSDCMEESLKSDHDFHIAAPSSSRAVTTGAIDSEHFLSPFVNGPLIPAAPTPFANGTRSRAVTAGIVNSEITGSKSQHAQTLKSSWTQPSLRQRLFSRVMSGVSGKPHVSHAAMEREAVVRNLHGNAAGKAEPVKDAQVGRPRSGTASSIETMSTLGGDLELALAAFPTPPKSTVTSPTTISSFETSRTTAGSPRRLVQPANVAISGARLNLLPEIDQLSFDSGQSMFVAVEITGDAAPIDKTCDFLSHSKGLDVAVVIDGT